LKAVLASSTESAEEKVSERVLFGAVVLTYYEIAFIKIKKVQRAFIIKMKRFVGYGEKG
tara:strand:+ start:374 stop:550 length:177 start_codon:yes stop_codon:yes gene_type:complete